ncbi:MAG: hypothetical protein LAO76_22205 [Acidobacteriia bacterium]|nr:hypothetical protein [Terriglobia bacterium]
MSTSTTAGLPDGLKAYLWSDRFPYNETYCGNVSGVDRVTLIDTGMAAKTNVAFSNTKQVYAVIGALPNSIDNAPLFYGGEFEEAIAQTTLSLRTGWEPSVLNLEHGSGKTQLFCLNAGLRQESVETLFGSPSGWKPATLSFGYGSGKTHMSYLGDQLFQEPAETSFGNLTGYLNALPQAKAISSTALTVNPRVETKFEAAFQRNSDEYFEDGVESDFARELEMLAISNRDSASKILTRLLEAENLAPSVWGEAMRWLGQTQALPRESRVLLLANGLFSSAPAIRDGAIVGLASLRDTSSLPYLRKALDRETSDELRADMLTLIEWLSR